MSDASDATRAGDLRAEVATMCHELNNHLMAALAELDLLLMDVESDELRTSYGLIRASLLEMREAIAAIDHRG